MNLALGRSLRIKRYAVAAGHRLRRLRVQVPIRLLIEQDVEEGEDAHAVLCRRPDGVRQLGGVERAALAEQQVRQRATWLGLLSPTCDRGRRVEHLGDRDPVTFVPDTFVVEPGPVSDRWRR